jgi:TonB-dependent SusC/RagA subfamily outer membrane receptor
MKWGIVLFLVISFCSVQVTCAQKQNKKITISGVVTDMNNNPVKGAMIFVDQVKTNSVTGSKGFYRVKVDPAAKEILVYSPLNGADKLEINEARVINFVLNRAKTDVLPPNAPKEEEMYNIGYSNVSKKNLTSEVGKIDGQHAYQQSYTNIFDMIKDQVPGVEVVGKTIRIRNSFSFQLSADPLFVVDGIIVPQIDDISPFDVKSISVLKGASASVYGAQGANGVILITTLRGGDKK